MDYLENWQPISARIRGLNEAAKLDALLRPGGPGHTGSTAYLAQQCGEIFDALGVFRDTFGDRLPPASLKVLDDARRLHQPVILGGALVRCAVYNGTLGSNFGQRFQPANDSHPQVAVAA